MANVNDVKSKDIKLTLRDGKERIIRFDLNAMAEMEDRYGSVDAAFAELDKNSIKALRFILWAGLVHEDESLTEKQVGSLIDMAYMQEIIGTLSNAFENDMPVDDTTNNEGAADPNA